MTAAPDTKKLAEDVNRIFEVSKEINYEDGQVTAVLRDLLTLMGEMREALEKYVADDGCGCCQSPENYDEIIAFEASRGEILARIEPLKHLMEAK